MILSFAMTVDDFTSGEKTATRRFWKERTVKMWQKAWDDNRHIHDGYDKGPRNGGSKVGVFGLVKRPYLQPLSEMTAEDLRKEGPKVWEACDGDPSRFPWFVEQRPDAVACVIEFMVLSECDHGAEGGGE